jgi:lipid-A-disaccharide synthase
MGRRRLLIVAGEASGDELAARVLAELRLQVGPLDVRGLGGPALARQGMHLDIDLRDTTAMGAVEVLRRLPPITAAWYRLAQLARRWVPQAALLVDLPDFNMPLAARLKALGIAVHGLVAPQFWAWRTHRVEQIARWYDEIACLFPFEVGPLQRAGAAAYFVGHPLADAPSPNKLEARRALRLSSDASCLALLPGSRPSEVTRLLPPLVEAVQRLKGQLEGANLEVLIPVASSLRTFPSLPRWLRTVTADEVDLPARQVLAAADAALVASGTATLEAGLLGVPQLVVYRLSPISYAAARLLVRTRHISLPNILLQRQVVVECLQGEVQPDVVCWHARHLLQGGNSPELWPRAARELRQALAGPGVAAVASRLAPLLER